MNLNQEIKNELRLAFSPLKVITETKAEIYRKIGERYGVHPERVRKHHRIIQAREGKGLDVAVKAYNSDSNTFSTKSVDNIKGTLSSSVEANFDPKNDQELAQLHNIDLTKYKIANYWSKMSAAGKFTSSVLCTLKDSTTDLGLQKELILNELKKYSPKAYNKLTINSTSDCLLEIAIPDIHFGKLSHAEESGEDYDLKIAGERFHAAIDNIIKSVDLKRVERIFFPIGNDMFNVDNMQSTTTGGTPQDTDTRFHKMIKYAKAIIIEGIDKLSTIAPVDVSVVPGNHDEQTAFMMGEILEAFYHNNGLVNVDNSPMLRKYYKYGNTSLLLTHGDKEKHANLGMIFAAEQPQIWASTKYRFIQLGHFHHNKKISYLSNDEYQGFQIQVLPSLSPNDKWHYGKGFISLKQAKGFLFQKETGLIAELTYTVPNNIKNI